MKNIFTLKEPTSLLIKKMMALALLIYVQMLYILPAQSQNPIVTNSATYDVFMNIDPARGLNPTTVATDISTYLTTMGAPANSYRIITSAVTLDPTDVAKWEVYDHYDVAWYANQAAWSASPGGFNNGSIPSNWYYYGVSDYYSAGAYAKTTIKDLLANPTVWAQMQTHGLESHIYPYVENGKPAMQFYGYGQIAAADFLYYPADVASTKTVKFDVDASNVSTHTLNSAGFLINGGSSGTGASKTISGYLLLFSWSGSPVSSLTGVKIYKLTNVNADTFHNDWYSVAYNTSTWPYQPGELIATSTFSTFYTKSHIELSITSTSLTATIQQLDGSGNLTGSKSNMFNSQALTNSGFGGFGPIVLYEGHGCTEGTGFRFSNIEMALGSVLAGTSSLESYQFAEYLDNSPNRFFVNLTNTAATNYTGTSNDMDNAYLTRIKDDKAIVITDESTGTYLPGTLNENIKNVTTEPTDATVAAALGLADLSSLTAAQKLAAKLAYLIKNTTLGAYGTIPIPTTSAVASLYLMDGPGTDANWTGANQVNEILSWIVSGTSVNIFLNPDNGVNTTGLTPTFKLKNPSGTITTITTSTDVNGKKYFTFPKTSATGNYSATLSYAIGGSITSTVPATANFSYAAPPALDGNPSISGTMQYGQVLTLTPNITSVPGLTGTLSYQWKANGTIITGATGLTYTLTANEVGKTITCDITSNVQTGTVIETATGTVSKITISASISAVNSKTYNGNTATTGGTIIFVGTVNSESPTSTSSIVWTSANAGTSTLNVTGISLTSLSDRYVLSVTTLSNVTPGNNATITKATPTVSAYPTATPITYGQMLSSSTLNTGSAVVNGVSGAIAGSYAWKTSTTKPATAGNFTTATVTFTPTTATNYNNIDFDINVTVSKAPLAVAADAKTKVYGAANPALTLQYSGWVNGDDSGDLTTLPTASTTVSATTSAAVHSNAITVSGGVDESYSFSYTPANFTVTKATLTVSADAKSKKYGAANPELTFQYSGWLNGDDSGDLTTAPTATASVTAASPVGVYAGAITLSGGSDDNYSFTFNAASLEVTKATLTVTADAKTKVYGEANPSLTFQYGGWKNGDDTEDLTTIPTASATLDVTTPVNTYTNDITIAGGVDENYDFAYFAADFTVTPATLTVTADAKSKVYGETNPALTFNYSGWVNGDDSEDLTTLPSASTTVTPTTSAGVHSVAITLAGGADENYSFSYTPANFEVTKATLAVSADAKTKVYGAANPVLTFQYSGWLNGDDSEDLTTVPNATASVTAASPVAVYSGAITLADGADENYTFTYAPADLEVTKALLKLTADAKTKVYGEANPSLTFQYGGWKNGDDTGDLTTLPTASATLDVASPVNTYTNDITVTGGVDENYDFAYFAADFTVTPATLTVIADAKTKVYGEANPALTYSISGYLNGDDESDIDTKPAILTTADELSDVLSYPIVLAGGNDNNYTLSLTDGALTVTKATLTAIADSKSKVYGEMNPTFTIAYSGFKNSDDVSAIDNAPSASTTATQSSDAGNYSIVLSAGSDNNYDIANTAGNLIIAKADLTVTAENKTRIYSESNPELTFTYSGFVNSENQDVLDTRPAAATVVLPSDNTGTYPIIASGGSDNNYNFTYNDGILSVTKSMLTINAENKTRKYGEINPVLTYAYSGFKNNDDASDIDQLPALTTAAISTTPVGTLPVTLSGGNDNNYDFTLINGTLSVTKTPLAITADNKTKVYGQANPALTLSWAGFVNGEDKNALLQVPQAVVATDVNSNTGTYPITIAGATSLNYAISYNQGNLTVTKAPLQVNAVNVSKKYLEQIPALTVTYSGFVNGDLATVLDVKPTATAAANANTDAGTYDITAAGGSDNNYSYIYNKGVITILKADQVISFEDVPAGHRVTQDHPLVASSVSNLPVSFTSSDPFVVNISGTNMVVEKEGTVQITAHQEGNHNWNPAADVTITVITLPTFDNIRSLFTPNNDGMNDTWYIPDIEQLGKFSIQIYNRFGKLLYESSAYKNDWDGTYNGTPLPSASYYYLIKSDVKGIVKGVVNIVR